MEAPARPAKQSVLAFRPRRLLARKFVLVRVALVVHIDQAVSAAGRIQALAARVKDHIVHAPADRQRRELFPVPGSNT